MKAITKDGLPARADWRVEIQIHPSDIRKRVRYLFLNRFQVTVLSLLALLYLLTLALAVALAPGVIGGFMNRQEYYSLAGERGRQGERLQALVRQLDHMHARAQRLGFGVSKVLLAYALPRTPAPRTGPAEIAEALPDSIYAGVIQQGDRLSSRIGEQLRQIDNALNRVQDFEKANQDRVRTTPSICPLRGELVLTSSFRSRRSPFTKQLEFHSGLDFAAPLGTPVHATADGVVAFAGKYPMGPNVTWWRYGNLVALRNGDLFVTLFGNCDQLQVRPGQKVKRGDVLGTVGNSGWSISPHLYYEVRKRDAEGEPRPVDPLMYILDRRWPNEERLLFGGRNVPPPNSYEFLPKSLGR
ncbi:MAG TPA: M23 family metallopeptidase [Thermoanaerobaculia bacterium]|jgi:murein DD-endopeptidase MepM/ murein hydrolase activator NlpD|nr:M23 family metallopeptidase [Thermoanaerobaculia bacterium]